jgi:hypothetical protein
MADFSKPPMRDGGINFPWFNWFRRLYEFVQSLRTDVDGKQPLDGDLTAIAALSGTGILERTGVDTWSLTTISSAKLKSQEYSSTSGNWTWPTGVDLAWVTLVGGGGGGGAGRSATTGYGGVGGGSGECLWRIPFPRAGVTTTAYSAGAGGVPGATAGANGGNGQDTTFGTLTALGGKLGGGGSSPAAPSNLGLGGGRLAAATSGTASVLEGLNTQSGASAGMSGNTAANGNAGGPSEQYLGGLGGTLAAGTAGAGGGGGASMLAAGGKGGNSTAGGTGQAGADGAYGSGAGGGGGGSTYGNGGRGGAGYILIEWVG